MLNRVVHVVSRWNISWLGLSKEKKRAVRKRAAALIVDKGEVFLKRKGRHVKVVTLLLIDAESWSLATPITLLGTLMPRRHGGEWHSDFIGEGCRRK